MNVAIQPTILLHSTPDWLRWVWPCVMDRLTTVIRAGIRGCFVLFSLMFDTHIAL